MSYLPILTYHRLLDEAPAAAVDPKRISVSAEQFYRHCLWLNRLGYRTLSLDTYVRDLRAGKPQKPRTFAITFDDGYEEVLTRGWPILQKFGFTATVFAVPGELGGRNAWDQGHVRLLNADQYRTLDRAGITIGAHTMTHVHLPETAPEMARREISDSKRQMEDLLGHSITTFAYPYGEYNSDIEKWVQEAGFEAAFTTDRAPADHAGHFYRLRRAVIFPRNNTWEILWKAQPWYPAYQDWKRGSRS